MNLQRHLLTRIAGVALACLLVIAAYVLYQSHCVAKQTTLQMTESLGKQLESQLLLINAGLGQTSPFPDFEPWKQSGNQPGICLSYASADGSLPRSICNGSKPRQAEWPSLFETGYRQIFNPGLPAVRSIAVNGKVYGTLTITPGAELEIAEAWNKILSLMTLSGVTVFAVCLLVYWSISRALKPATIIIGGGINRMESGDRDYCLPAFELNEWQCISTAINQLANSQQQLLDERQKLVVKLIHVQENERRYLARELHDEFGQCLAAINAVAASIKQTAALQCPALVGETDQISRITTHMLGNVRDLLSRLHPAEFDELGLDASLNSLVTGWNARTGGKTHFQLDISGDCSLLAEASAMTLFRISQECLTNIAKHASASNVSICLTIGSESAILKIVDDGVAKALPFADSGGIGLLGIRERVTALHGCVQLAIANPHGLIVEVCLPMATAIEHTA